MRMKNRLQKEKSKFFGALADHNLKLFTVLLL